jgi:hypothetical protein
MKSRQLFFKHVHSTLRANGYVRKVLTNSHKRYASWLFRDKDGMTLEFIDAQSSSNSRRTDIIDAASKVLTDAGIVHETSLTHIYIKFAQNDVEEE